MTAADVELDIFSGATNPTWSLDGAQAADLLAMVDALAVTEPRPAPGNLGYRGMIARIHEPARRDVRLHSGIVESGGTHYADPERRTARWLLETGRPVLPADVYTIAEREL